MFIWRGTGKTVYDDDDMATGVRKGPARRSIHVSPDLAGFAVAITVATIVMGFGFMQGVDGFEIAFRVVATFALSWTAVFVLVLVFERIVLAEEAARRRAKRAAEAEERARQEEAERQSVATPETAVLEERE